jgi:hypothetical protein
MGGELSCTSTLGVGSVFTFTLLLAGPAVAAAPAVPAAEVAPAPVPQEPAWDLPRPRRAPPWVTAPPRPEPADGVIAP